MESTSRRDFLKRSAAMAALLAPDHVAFVPVTDPDADLMVLLAAFHKAHVARLLIWEGCEQRQAQVEALPGCPDRFEDGKAWDRFLESHGVWSLWAQGDALLDHQGAIANRIFQTPARTLRGALEKLRIAHTAVGDGESSRTGDPYLENYQDPEQPWLLAVIADIESLEARARSRA